MFHIGQHCIGQHCIGHKDLYFKRHSYRIPCLCRLVFFSQFWTGFPFLVAQSPHNGANNILLAGVLLTTISWLRMEWIHLSKKSQPFHSYSLLGGSCTFIFYFFLVCKSPPNCCRSCDVFKEKSLGNFLQEQVLPSRVIKLEQKGGKHV